MAKPNVSFVVLQVCNDYSCVAECDRLPQEGTSASLLTKRAAGSKQKRRNRSSTSGEGTPDEADELCAEWARKASACRPVARCAERMCMEKSPSPDATTMGSSEADWNSSHDGASRSTESPQGNLDMAGFLYTLCC